MNATLLETINQKCEGTVRYGKAPQEIISTGLSQLDAAAGGGIPRGRIVEIYGSEGSGKTALALHLAQQTGGAVLFLLAICRDGRYNSNTGPSPGLCAAPCIVLWSAVMQGAFLIR